GRTGRLGLGVRSVAHRGRGEPGHRVRRRRARRRRGAALRVRPAQPQAGRRGPRVRAARGQRAVPRCGAPGRGAMKELATSPGVRTDDWLLNQLPAAMVADDFFARFVRIFQAQGSTLLVHADNVTNLADPSVAPPELVRWMTGWIGASGVDPSYPDEVHRAVLRQAS